MSRVTYGQSGYSGSSRSVRAVLAEADYKLPLTRAARLIAEAANCTQIAARQAAQDEEACEWHHTSKWGNRTDYYDCREIAAKLLGCVGDECPGREHGDCDECPGS